MATCDKCGNSYDKAFEIILSGRSYTFDCFECAISMLAPSCPQCETRIIGHGVEEDGRIYCCANCAKQAGVQGLQDRA